MATCGGPISASVSSTDPSLLVLWLMLEAMCCALCMPLKLCPEGESCQQLCGFVCDTSCRFWSYASEFGVVFDTAYCHRLRSRQDSWEGTPVVKAGFESPFSLDFQR
jgi:hypothetical protein